MVHMHSGRYGGCSSVKSVSHLRIGDDLDHLSRVLLLDVFDDDDVFFDFLDHV